MENGWGSKVGQFLSPAHDANILLVAVVVLTNGKLLPNVRDDNKA